VHVDIIGNHRFELFLTSGVVILVMFSFSRLGPVFKNT